MSKKTCLVRQKCQGKSILLRPVHTTKCCTHFPSAKIELEGVDAEDFEDIAVGPGPLPGLNYIYVGDIGNNDEDRDEVQIYRFLEPDLAGLR